MADLGAFNAAAHDAAERDALACCESHAFAKLITDGRPYPDSAALYAGIDTAFEALTWDDIVEAMAGHPRIGERKPTGDTQGQSAAEQSGATTASNDVRQAIAAGNLDYEQRFGHVFLICASGRSGQDMLTELRKRLLNTPTSERAVARQELRKITRLRMGKMLSL
jgi:2-oxo-4-hydroxy-4-carboxy-5-ureidoimidazoline decarboxylase